MSKAPERDPHPKTRVARSVIRHQKEQHERASWQTTDGYATENNARRQGYVQYTSVEGGLLRCNESLFPNSSIQVHIRRKLESVRPVRVLDFGCGAFAMGNELRKEFSPEVVQLTGTTIGDPRTQEQKDQHEGNTVEFIATTNSPIPRLKSERRQFDLIVSRLVFMHAVHPLRLVERLYELLAPGGELRCDFNARILESVFAGESSDTKKDRLRRMFDDLKSTGVDIEITDDHLFITKPLRGHNTISFSRWCELVSPAVKSNAECSMIPFGPKIVLYTLK